MSTETVAWYGGGVRQVGLITNTGHWYKAGEGLVPIAWVFVRDQSGTHRDEFFFTTDTTMTAVAMVEAYAARWNIEKDQADCTSSDRWCAANATDYHRCRRAA